MYNELLHDLEQVILPQPPNDGDHFDIFQNYEIRAQDRDSLQLYLKNNGVGTLLQWSGKAIHHFNSLGFDNKLPYTDQIFDEIIMLPLNLFISDQDVEYISNCIRGFYLR